MSDPVRILVVGLGNMGASHASAYHRNEGFEIVGLCARSIRQKPVPSELNAYPLFDDYEAALAETRPDAVSINTWPDTHAAYAIRAMEAGAHVFMEKPIATSNRDAAAVVAKARETERKLVLGYILRVHPSWMRFIELGRGMGKPLVMRLNLNQQSSGAAWEGHRRLMESLTPIVDCGVHYVDVMCQLTGAKPVRVHGIGAPLWEATERDNYGHLHVTFDDGSVGWYEAGWGPMMSETAYFVKDVIGPRGSVSLVPDDTPRSAASQLSSSADIDKHTRTDAIRVHYAEVDEAHEFVREDEVLSMEDEPGHQELCDREQAFFLRAIREDLDLTDSMEAAVNSLRIVLAAEESIATEQAVRLD
ncbi:probable Myo-inositol 2-dehydrogenase [Oceanicola granulosus HTCC2516]|uniref:Probable Myo-inositol 2-dehydrogenase n=1 Tax=Oceanicola granulosus (strain ATCC BAA-861 / DSM 15982 / KCTC 12143 / HTCC2516) TaxID=314256 RepID=Q2CBZ4_OCEGH|nr:Gfo/Idh/MocA family oxidoreductase [Oceanicola granulosus]EAR50200.1 probable Myo-inositol 2-dehydrogenase [Oceanicola granulosus HTCC2516]